MLWKSLYDNTDKHDLVKYHTNLVIWISKISIHVKSKYRPLHETTNIWIMGLFDSIDIVIRFMQKLIIFIQ